VNFGVSGWFDKDLTKLRSPWSRLKIRTIAAFINSSAIASILPSAIAPFQQLSFLQAIALS
jgi:hypothetical protein